MPSLCLQTPPTSLKSLMELESIHFQQGLSFRYVIVILGVNVFNKPALNKKEILTKQQEPIIVL